MFVVKSSSVATTRLRCFLGGLSIVFGLLYGWTGRSAFHNIDGISYLDMGDAYLRGDLSTAINGLWSPLYGILMSAVLKVVHAPASREFLVIHVVDFAIYIMALLCFDFLWREFGCVLAERSTFSGDVWVSFPQWAWYLLGYSLFLWVSLKLITVLQETPDMLLSGELYVATTLVLRISRRRAKLLTFVLLGLVLGFGYLTKAIFFPLAFVFLIVVTYTVYEGRQSLAGPAIAASLFLVVATPMVLALSHAKGRFTFGDSGIKNYLWHVDGVPWIWWLNDFPNYSLAKHPPRMLLDRPRVYEFSTPFVATFPPWYDPSYWYDGIDPHFDPKKQIRAVANNVGIYRGMFFKPGAVLVVVSLILFCIGRSAREIFGRLDVLLPSVTALTLYALIHVESRYVGPFFLTLWGALLCQVRLPKSAYGSRLLKFSTLAIVIVYSVDLSIGGVSAIHIEKESSANMQIELEAAHGLLQAGLQPHDRIAVIGGITGMIWSRLDRLQVVASSADDADAWMQDAATRERVLSAFAATGAKVIVAAKAPSKSADGWVRIRQTPYYFYSLAPWTHPLH